MIRLYILLGVCLFFGASCCEEPDDDPFNLKALNQEPLWESEMLYIEDPNNRYLVGPHYLNIDPIYDGIIMTGYSRNENERLFVGLDLYTGKRVWTGEHITYNKFSIHEGHQFQDGKYLYFYDDEQNFELKKWINYFYQFDITTGALIFRKNFPQSFGGNPTVVRHLDGVIVSLDPNYIDPVTGWEENRFFIHSTQNVESREVLDVPRAHNNRVYEDVGTVVGTGLQDFTVVSDGSDIFLVYILNESNTWERGEMELTTEDYIYNINCYNITKREWVYQNKPCEAGDVAIVSHDDVIYCGNGGNITIPTQGGFSPNPRPLGLYSYNWKTGELLWRKGPLEFDPVVDFSTHALAYHNGTLIFSGLGYMYGVDAQTGNVKWKRRGIGNSGSAFVFHNGVAYATSASGLLHGWDIQTGEVLLEALCPSEGKIHNDTRIGGFWADIGLYIDPDGKGYLLARNYLYMYAFEAVR